MSEKPMILSINVPFCPVRCAYCDKRTTVIGDLDVLDRYADALRREIEYSAGDYADDEIQAIWIGGGIPSHLFDEKLGELLMDMRRWYRFAPDTEITLKAHPGMVSVETLNACRAGRVSRLSIEFVTANGFEDEPLGRFLPASAMDTTKIVLQNTALSLSFDLILGLPAQTPGTLTQSLDKAVSYGAKHISLYPLRVTQGTPFADGWVRQHAGSASLRQHLPDDQERAALAEAAREWLSARGFTEYLPGHYAMDGFACRYLILEQNGCETLGFGAGAETRMEGMYTLNTRSISAYCRFSPDPQKLTQVIRPLR